MTQQKQLTWLGGNPGDGWYEMTEKLLPMLHDSDPTLRVVLRAGGGEQNLADIQAGHAEIGMSIDIVTSAAVTGAAPFDAPMAGLACLGTAWSPLPYNVLQAVEVTQDFDEAATSDGFRVGAPPRDTTDELTFQRVVTSYFGTTYEGIVERGGTVRLDGYEALIRALETGEIDYVFGATTMPAPSIATASSSRRSLRLADLAGGLIDFLVRRYGCTPGVIPAGTYPQLQEGPVATAFVDTVFVAAADLDLDLAYRVTSALLTNLERLPLVHESFTAFNPHTAWRNTPAALHPGAARAFREHGFMA